MRTRVSLREIEEKVGKNELISEILGIDQREYIKLEKAKMDEYIDILKTNSYTKAAVRLLRWLGLDGEEVDLEKVVKAIAVIKYSVVVTNYASSKATKQK